MSFSQFFIDNWFLFLLFALSLCAIFVYEFKNRGKSGYALSNIAAATLINQGATLIDLRATADYKKGHIAGAKNIPPSKLQNHIKSLKQDTPILLYCQNGLQAPQQARQIQATHPNTYILKSGLEGWEAENLPVVS